MTQQQLAQELGVSVTSVASWEQGRYDPNAKQFRTLVALFGVDVGDLVLPSEQPASDERPRMRQRSGGGDE